jgi:transcriptional regulator with XRE-family HTH domain
MYMSISERLQMVIKMNGMTNASFADEIGVQRSSISHVLAGRNKPSIDFIQKILMTFPKVNADWLVTGKRIGKISGSTEEVEVKEERNVTTEVNAPIQTIHEEEPGEYKGVSREKPVENREPDLDSQRKITKILVFYDDGTFEETVPKH